MQRITPHYCYWLACLALLLTQPVSAENNAIDWPTFQGNNARTGASDYPAIAKPKIAWSTKIGIMGYLNCPVIDGDLVFVTSSGDRHNVPDDRDGVYCLSLKSGEVLWHYKTRNDACGITIDKDRVYVGDDSGQFCAINRATGEPAWSIDCGGSVFGAPLRAGDIVVATGFDGEIVACDPATGEVRWVFDHDDNIRAALSSDGEHLYAVYLHGRCVCFDLDGKMVWQRDALDAPPGEVETREIYGAPTLTEDSIFFGFSRDTTYDMPAISRLSKEGAVDWCNQGRMGLGRDRIFSCGNIRSSFAVQGELLIHGEPYGNATLWTRQSDGGIVHAKHPGVPMFPHWPSPVLAKNTAYLARHDGGLYAIDTTGPPMDQLWMAYLGDNRKSAINDFPGELNRLSGRPHWEPAVGKPIYATPAIAKDGTLVIGTGQGWLYCIKEKQ